MTDNQHKDADGTLTNPECGNSIGYSCSAGEVRWFPTGGGSHAIMCEACAKHYGYKWESGFLDDNGSKGERAQESTQCKH
ncbi:MAG: hypothetical protein ACYTEQ_00885 [Planctomycetota bacterium]|jgi:hypothetical protein